MKLSLSLICTRHPNEIVFAGSVGWHKQSDETYTIDFDDMTCSGDGDHHIIIQNVTK